MLELYCKVMAYFKADDGAETVEYALVVGLFAIAAVLAMIVAGTAISGMFSAIATRLNAAATSI